MHKVSRIQEWKPIGTAGWSAPAALFSLGLSFAFGLGHLPAAEVPPPIFKTAPAERRKVVEERISFFTVMKYEPRAKVALLRSRSEASYVNPEKSAISQASAMAASDYEWWLSTWSDDSRRMIEERNRTLSRSPDFWRATWDRVLKGRSVELAHRIETGEYVLIEYVLVPMAGIAEKEIEAMVVLKEDGGRWLATQDLASDPVLLKWKNPEEPLRRIIRP